MNLNVHFHIVHLDGVYDRGADDALRFFQATPTNEDIEALAVDIATACERWLSQRGFSGEAHDDDPDVGEDDAQGLLQLASLMGMSATGERAGKKARRTQRLGGREIALGPRCAAFEGYNIHANVSFDANDRGGLERLCGYVLRPPLALGRLERLPSGRVFLGFKRAWSDGTSGIELSTQELVEKLAATRQPGALRRRACGQRGIAGGGGAEGGQSCRRSALCGRGGETPDRAYYDVRHGGERGACRISRLQTGGRRTSTASSPL